jgi:hypothetical protein
MNNNEKYKYLINLNHKKMNRKNFDRWKKDLLNVTPKDKFNDVRNFLIFLTKERDYEQKIIRIAGVFIMTMIAIIYIIITKI